jgi:type IV secretory pathway VirB2 component (pilin)
MTPRRIVVTVVLVVGIVTTVAVPINWGAVDWGTVPTWIGAIALVFIAAAAWIAVLSRNSESHRSRSL